MKHNYLDWAISHRTLGTDLRFINQTYYLYQVSAYYDPVLKKGKKKTGPLLGKITKEGGFISSEKKLLEDKAQLPLDVSKISIRECGFTKFLSIYGIDIEKNLKMFFPKYYKTIIYMSYCRLTHNSPLNRMSLPIHKSMLIIDDKESYYPKKLSDTLFVIGVNRALCVDYRKSFITPDEHILADMTNMFNNTGRLYYTKEGYNSDMVFDTQINLM